MARKLKRMYNLRAKWYHRIFFTTFWLLLKIIYCKIQQIEFTDSMISIIRSPFRNRPQFPLASSTPSNTDTEIRRTLDVKLKFVGFRRFVGFNFGQVQLLRFVIVMFRSYSFGHLYSVMLTTLIQT